MRSLSAKLTLAFLLVSLIGIGLAAAFIWTATSSQFDRFVLDQRQSQFVAAVSEHYRLNGNWHGVDTTLRDQGLLPPPVQPGQTPPDPQPFALADQDRVIVIAAGEYQSGQKVQRGVLARGISIEIGGVQVGTVLTTGDVPLPSPIEEKYFASVNRALLIGALGGLTAALLLGLALTRSLTHPARDLTAAARALARGELGQQVPVSSRDELGQLGAAFNQMSADLDRLSRARRQMTADIAHDLRNPLTVIAGYVEALRDGTLQPTAERFEAIHAEVAHLQHLVEDLRMLSLAEAGELALHPQPVAARDLLERLADGYRLQAESRDVRLLVEAADGLPDLRVDPERMEQVLRNLIDNALRHTPAGGQITLLAVAGTGEAVLGVRDTGDGIPAEALAHVFERSYRGDPSRQGGRSGLGLAIARSLVELHGGRIEASSAGPGKGSLFLIHLPEIK